VLKIDVAVWLWTIIAKASENHVAQYAELVSEEFLAPFLSTFRPFLPSTPSNDNVPPENTDARHIQLAQLNILKQACKILLLITSLNDRPASRAFVAASPNKSSPIFGLMEFAEEAAPPPDWAYNIADDEEEDDSDDDELLTRQHCEKMVGRSKAAVIQIIIEISWDLDQSGNVPWFWDKMREWIERKDDRDDLVSCALLCYGNCARTDATAERLATGDTSILPIVLPLLSSPDPKVQHAVVGLLSNLSVSVRNRARLGEQDVALKLVQSGVWQPKMDMLGSVQGGAVRVIRLLCANNAENAARFVNNEDAVAQLLALINRTTDQAIEFEGTRIFVNAIKSLASHNTLDIDRSCLIRLADPMIISCLSKMVKKAEKYPILVNDAIIGLTLLATFGPAGTVPEIRSQFMGITEEGVTGNGAIGFTVSESSSWPGIRENADKLLAALQADRSDDARNAETAMQAEVDGANLEREARALNEVD